MDKKQDELIELARTTNEKLCRVQRTLRILFPSEYISLYHLSEAAHPAGLLKFEPQDEDYTKFLVSTEPSSRNQLIKTTRRLDSVLKTKQAKPVGLCSIRRSIYDQCFDELIRQVTVGCVEQGLLLYRIRNELRMTMTAYRRVYESAVTYGISKAMQYELSQEERNDPETGSLVLEPRHDSQESSSTDAGRLDEIMQEMHGYYRAELYKKDQVIKRQRNIIDALKQNLIDQIKSPS